MYRVLINSFVKEQKKRQRNLLINIRTFTGREIKAVLWVINFHKVFILVIWLSIWHLNDWCDFCNGIHSKGFPGVVKNLPVNAKDRRDLGLIPGLGWSPEGGHSNPFQYSCPENPIPEEPGGLWSIGSQRVGHDWSDLACIQTFLWLPIAYCLYFYYSLMGPD